MVMALALVGCEQPVRVEGHQKAYQITDVRKPRSGKHSRPFRVSFKDVETGQVFARERVSRRCARWSEVKVGSKVTLTEAVYRYKDGTTKIRLEGVERICPSQT